jgi:hypothetical protein
MSGDPARRFVDAVITDVAREWVLADVVGDTWRYRVGTGLLLRRAALLESDGQLIAPGACVHAVYPPETRNAAHAMELSGNVAILTSVSMRREFAPF